MINFNLIPKTKTYEESRDHFIIRLKERYDIELSNNEYDELINNFIKIYSKNVHHMYKITYSRSLCCIKIKDAWVYCIWQKSHRESCGFNVTKSCFKTALKITDDVTLPVPRPLKRKGYTPKKFEADINDLIKDAYNARKILEEIGEKKFFTETNYNNATKGLAKNLNRWDKIKICYIVNHLIRKNNLKIL
jgi:hypothetical protein